MSRFLLSLMACAAAPAVLAATPAETDCRASSAAATAALVELYTSEGCSSCPPADRWLSGLSAGDTARGRVVPLALHVTYWDDLGWKDPYARAEFTARQHGWKTLHEDSYVYTPQVVLAGQDYRRWSDSRQFWRDVQAVNDKPARASIALSARPAGAAGETDIEVEVRIPAAADRAHAALFLATTADGVSSRVAAGENAGSMLHHDHLARSWAGPLPLSAEERTTVRSRLPAGASAPGRVPGGAAGVVAFVENTADGRILQAVAAACR